MSVGTRTSSEEASKIRQMIFHHSEQSEQTLFYQEHDQGELEIMLTTKPHEYKRCQLTMEKHDLAYATPLDDPTSSIYIRGIDNMGRSFPGDVVCVQILNRELDPYLGESLNGRVVGLLERSEECCTIICRMEGQKQIVNPIKNNMTRICILQKEPNKIEIWKRNPQSGYYFTEESFDIVEDQLLVVKVLKWEKKNKYPLGVITKVISQEEYLHEILKLKYGIKDPPPHFQPRNNQKEYGRTKFSSDLYTFTIDSSGAVDLDDAFTLDDKGEQYMLAIHITDVASYISKDSQEDLFAKMQGRTFYFPDKDKANPAFMFSREASKEYLSLLPNKNRNAISLVLMINKNTNMIESSEFTFSQIKCNKQLSYEKVDKIIEERCLDEHEAPLKFSSVEDCVAVAYCFAKVLRKYRLEGSWSNGQRKGNSRAKCMVEELMIFYNNEVAEILISNDLTRDLTPLRCHSKPDPDLFEKFKETHSIHLPLSPYLSQVCEAGEESFEETKAEVSVINVLKPVFHKMKALARERDYPRLLHLIMSDEIHPTLHSMAKEFKDIQKKAVTLRSCSKLSSKLGHYDLQLNAYTRASSPIRRYLDLIIQRLLHSLLSKEPTVKIDYTKHEIDQFCDKCDLTKELKLEFIGLINPIISSSETKLAMVEKLSSNEFNTSLPLDGVSGLVIQYRNLKVFEQPKNNGNFCTLSWKRRVYSFNKTSQRQHPSRMKKNVIPISVTDWTKMISAVKEEDWDKVSECIRDIEEEKEENNRMTTIMSEASEHMQEHFQYWNMEIKLKEVLQVQIGTEVINGAKKPAVNLLTVNESFEVCLEHARNSIKCFTRDMVCPAAKQKYEDYKEYQNIWKKMCEMDTAYNAVEENNSIILEDVRIIWTKTTGNPRLLTGCFIVTQTQKKDWSLEFDLTNCYLCIRLRNQMTEKDKNAEMKNTNGSDLSVLQNALPFTWVAHGMPHKPQSQTRGTGKKTVKKKPSEIKIEFSINHQNMDNVPPQAMEEKTRFTIEVIPKKIPYVQREHAMGNIKKANDLVKRIATGNVFDGYTQLNLEPKKPYPINLGSHPDLQPLNESQKRAVEKALTNPFTVIQGPPGTGKTVVGVHITYQFYLNNKVLEKKCPPTPIQTASENEKIPKKRGILYCGPSNKSVDIVAEQLMKLGDIKPLRIYCDQMEMREFPYPGSDLKLSLRSFRDEKSKEVLRDISLMYLVRKPENPFSEEIKNIEHDSEFDFECYKKVLKQAQKHELQKHDVILCTCSTALKPVLIETMDFGQILIDECAMATEPEAFIPLVSHNPKQIVLLGDHRQIRPIVKCARVKELGMEKSLFERYMNRALMLDTQYRMHESICEFPSNEFYNGKLKTGTQPRPCLLLNKSNEPTGILFCHVEGKETSLAVSTEDGNEGSAANEEEARQATRIASLLIRAGVRPEDIAILTPYNAQMSKIKELVKQDVNVCTIMKSQGSEWRYVILSTVRSCELYEIKHEPYKNKGWLRTKLGFITDPNQVNVAITRAQDGLCILGNRHLLNCSELWRRLLNHYHDNNCVLDSAEDFKFVQKNRY